MTEVVEALEWMIVEEVSHISICTMSLIEVFSLPDDFHANRIEA